jgi:hypothetical protein
VFPSHDPGENKEDTSGNVIVIDFPGVFEKLQTNVPAANRENAIAIFDVISGMNKESGDTKYKFVRDVQPQQVAESVDVTELTKEITTQSEITKESIQMVVRAVSEYMKDKDPSFDSSKFFLNWASPDINIEPPESRVDDKKADKGNSRRADDEDEDTSQDGQSQDDYEYWVNPMHPDADAAQKYVKGLIGKKKSIKDKKTKKKTKGYAFYKGNPKDFEKDYMSFINKLGKLKNESGQNVDPNPLQETSASTFAKLTGLPIHDLQGVRLEEDSIFLALIKATSKLNRPAKIRFVDNFKKMYAGIKKNPNYGIRASRPEIHSGYETLQENKQFDRWKLLAGIK